MGNFGILPCFEFTGVVVKVAKNGLFNLGPEKNAISFETVAVALRSATATVCFPSQL